MKRKKLLVLAICSILFGMAYSSTLKDTYSNIWSSYACYLESNHDTADSLNIQEAKDSLTAIALRNKSIQGIEYAIRHCDVKDRNGAIKVLYESYVQDGSLLAFRNFAKFVKGNYADTSATYQKDFKLAASVSDIDLLNIHSYQYKRLEKYIKAKGGTDLSYEILCALIKNDLKNRNWDKALATIHRLKPFFKGDKRVDNLITLLNTPEDYSVNMRNVTELNKEGASYNPVLTADDKHVYFCGMDKSTNIGKEDVFCSDWQDSIWSNPSLVKSLSTSANNNAVLSISTDGTSALLFEDGKIKQSEKGYKDWENPVMLPKSINVGSWNADAMESSDKNVMILAASRKKSENVDEKNYDVPQPSDIFVSFKDSAGEWQEPISIGPVINTAHDERSPFLHPDMHTLYFTSDGHGGLGGLDVFMTTRLSDTCWTCWSESVNLGKDINTSDDDWGYQISTNGHEVYFTKNTDGVNHIYAFNLPQKFRPREIATVSGKITDNYGNPVSTQIRWRDAATNKEIGMAQSDPSDGNYFITLPLEKKFNYQLINGKIYPVSKSIDLTTAKIASKIKENIQVIGIRDIYFNTAKHDIFSEYRGELDSIASAINSGMGKLEIRGHTDSIGDDDYNMKLSIDRANAVKNALIKLGCAPSQVTAIGFGETKPLEPNNTPEGRAKNRRVEFWIKNK